MKLTGLLGSPLVKSLLKKTFFEYMHEEGLKGIYVFENPDGTIGIRDYKEDPETQIQNLKKIIYE